MAAHRLARNAVETVNIAAQELHVASLAVLTITQAQAQAQTLVRLVIRKIVVMAAARLAEPNVVAVVGTALLEALVLRRVVPTQVQVQVQV